MDEVDRKRRELVKRFHPDRFSDPEKRVRAERVTAEINAAHDAIERHVLRKRRTAPGEHSVLRAKVRRMDFSGGSPVDDQPRMGPHLLRVERGDAGEDAWLERWRHVLEASRGSPVLDLGCGAGHDARFLTDLGFSVVAADFSEEALGITRRKAPAAKTQNVDLTTRPTLPRRPFRSNRREPLATLLPLASDHNDPGRRPSLPQTRRPLLARFNSTRDPRYSAAEKQQIENNFYLVRGIPKRLFDKHDIATLFEQAGRHWQPTSA